MGIFDFLRNKSRIEKNKESDTNYLFGFDIKNRWTYLGRTTMEWSNSKSTIPILFFAEKGNEWNGSRDFVLDGSKYKIDSFRDHKYLLNCKLWKAGEYELFQLIRETPSKWLSEEMKRKYNLIWDSERDWWTVDKSEERQKYDSALEDQKKSKKKIDPYKSDDSNKVITLFDKN